MKWTENSLKDAQDFHTTREATHPDPEAMQLSEVMRLARLGLAAETTGKAIIENSLEGAPGLATDAEVDLLNYFLDHPAWEPNA